MPATTMLKGHELFRSMGFEDVDRINGFSSVKELSTDEFVFKSGSSSGHVYVLLDGRIRLRSAAESTPSSPTVGFIEKGEFFGLSPLLARGHHLVAAQCAAPCKVLAIEAAPLRRRTGAVPAARLRRGPGMRRAVRAAPHAPLR